MSGSTPAVSIDPMSRRRASGTLAASRRKWSDHMMLMLQPPDCGSTYRYVLPGRPRGKPPGCRRLPGPPRHASHPGGVNTHTPAPLGREAEVPGLCGPAVPPRGRRCDDEPVMAAPHAYAQAGTGLRLLRAAVFTAVCVVVSAAGHVFASC